MIKYAVMIPDNFVVCIFESSLHSKANNQRIQTQYLRLQEILSRLDLDKKLMMLNSFTK